MQLLRKDWKDATPQGLLKAGYLRFCLSLSDESRQRMTPDPSTKSVGEEDHGGKRWLGRSSGSEVVLGWRHGFLKGSRHAYRDDT